MGFAKRLYVFLVIFGLAGCAVDGVKPDKNADAQSVVAKRAQSRWDALIKGDVATAYEYLSPGSRSVMSLELYKAKIRTGLWKKVKVDSVACEKDRCNVAVTVEYSYPKYGMESISSRLDEVWLQEDGDWWYVQKK